MYSNILKYVMLLITSSGTTGFINPPRNVRLNSTNMNMVLRWDSPEGATNDLLYTAECISVRICQMGCVNISTLECDFSNLSNYLSVYGRYKARVKAIQGPENSSWVESKPITMDSDTTIGPPNVQLISTGARIQIEIEDPEFAISNIKSVFGDLTYNITYWNEGQSEKRKHISNLRQNQILLQDLDSWTTYCVQVQINAARNKYSQPSQKVCKRTASNVAVDVPSLVIFLFVIMAIPLLVTAVVYRRRISIFFCPEDNLPQYLLATPSSSPYKNMCNSDRPEEIYSSVDVIAEEIPGR
ncbi:interleukin-10 receptor subunit beta-like isoform X2 [Stigmatopora nigra]